MKRCLKNIKFPVIMLALVLLFMSFSPMQKVSLKSHAAAKAVPNRTIAIVYDNSGSMFNGTGNTRWCQAQYAIEIFASMMNQGDKMIIYPMRPVYLNAIGNGQQYNYWSNPYVITTDAQKTSVRNFITDHKNFSDNTPIESLDAAYEGLSKEQGEKWLIVMTDGATFNEGKDEKDIPVDETRIRLGEQFNKYLSSTNVVYLGIGDSIKAPSATPQSESFEYISKITSSEEIPSNLTVLCNRIFGRDQMQEVSGGNDIGYSDNSIKFDLSLSKLYLFVQGKNIENVKLTKNGAAISSVKTFSPKFGVLGHATNYNNPFQHDELRQGCIAVYENLEPGTYTYSYNGSMSSVAVYYEPDVDLIVTLTDDSGKKITDFSKVQPGKYKLNYMLVDARDATKPLESILLGDVYYDVDYTLAGKQETKSAQEKHGTCDIQLDANQSLTLVSVEVSYLNGYRIKKTGQELGFPSGGIMADKADAKAFEIICTGGKEAYDPDKINEEGKYTVTFKYDGAQITGANVDNVTIDAESLGTNVSVELLRNGDVYTLSLKAPEDISTVNAGEYSIYLTGTYDPKVEKPGSAAAQVNYKVNEITQKLALEFKDLKKNYAILSIKKGKDNTMLVKVTLDGEMLTDEQLSSMQLTIAGLPLNAEPLNGQSAFRVTFDKDATYKKGKYSVTAKAEGIKDRKGRFLETSKSVDVKLNRLPGWIVFLIVLGIILLLLALILFVLTRKVLPYKVVAPKAEVSIDGEPQIYNCRCTVSNKYNLKKRTISSKSDLIPNSAYNSFSMRVDIKNGTDRSSWLMVPSKKRHYIINGFACPAQGAEKVFFGSKEYLLKSGKPINEDGTPFKPVVVKKNKFPITVNGVVDNKNYEVEIKLDIKK